MDPMQQALIDMDGNLSYTKRAQQYGGSIIGVLQKRSISDNECLQLQVSSNSQLHEFGRTFAELASGLDNIPKNFTGDVILFVGNTGVGKSTLVHILAGESATFVVRENGVDSGDFYIEDTSGKFVKNSTLDSATTYPEAFVDAASGAVLFDTPGFGDTRSTIHEIVATYGLRKVAEVSQRIKIAILVNYNSLKPKGSRDDFTNTLESFFNLFNNTQKFQDSTYLIATKTENRFIFKRGEMIPVSAATHIKNIITFMNNASQTLENRKGKYGDADENFIRNAQALIGSLEKKVALFMEPDISGPISESRFLQQSLQSIREMLLVDDGYVRVEVGDFGFAVSDKAKVYIRNLYDLMNSHIEEVSKSFAIAFKKFIISQTKSFDNIEAIRSNLQNTAQQVTILIHTTNASATPGEYVDAIMNLTASVKIEFCSKHVVDEIKQLDGYLDGLEKITDHYYYTPSKWSELLYPLERLVQNELMFYGMLDNLYNKITDYSVMFSDPTVQAQKLANASGANNLEEVENFIQHLGLTQYASLQITPEKRMQISSLMKSVVGKQNITCYKSNTLVILDSVLRTSILDLEKMATCQHTTTVVLVATRKLYIDADIGVDLLKGRNLVVIAPEWHIMGRFTLSVDGESAQNQSWDRAAWGKVGLDGKPGHSAGMFVGVALRYFNSEWLTISASGGNGGPGQDGGNGQDGRDGRDGTEKVQIDEKANIYIVYNHAKEVYLIRADDYGTKGGDAGQGGMGGSAGSAGSVKMYSLSKHSPDRSTHHLQAGTRGRNGEDGRPGKGGFRGCDIIEEQTGTSYLIVANFNTERRVVEPCRRHNDDGVLLPRSKPSVEISFPVRLPPNFYLQILSRSICLLYKTVKHHFEEYDIISRSTAVEFQKALYKEFGC